MAAHGRQTTLTPAVDIRRAANGSPRRSAGSTRSTPSPSAHHHDPRNTHHGLLLVNNDDVVRPGSGFDTHPHRDMEIVTWVLQRLPGPPGLHRPLRRHLPRAGPTDERRVRASCTRRRTTPGASTGSPTRRPRALRADVGRARRGRHHARLRAARDRRRPAAQAAWCPWPRHGRRTTARPRSGSRTVTPPCMRPACSPAERRPARRAVPAPVRPAGSVTLEGAGVLDTGDAVRFTATGGQRVTAVDAAEVLVWEMHAALAG